MIKKILFILMFLLSMNLLAEDLFQDCSNTKNDITFHPLNKYLSANDISATMCQKLNNKEYIYTEWDNFYYCNFAFANTYDYCQQNEKGTYYANLNVELRFNGKNNKKFVLFKSEDLKFGIYKSLYVIFFFTPKKFNHKGYELVPLYDVGEFYSEVNKCDNLNLDSNTVELINYKIINEGKNNVGIQFIQKITSCKTNKSNIRTLEYIWSGETFKLSK